MPAIVTLVTHGASRLRDACYMELADGSWIFLASIILLLISLVAGLYTRAGSGINDHPYARRYSDAPGANTDRRRISGRDGIASISSRGTR